jgi:hypothetical protein
MKPLDHAQYTILKAQFVGHCKVAFTIRAKRSLFYGGDVIAHGVVDFTELAAKGNLFAQFADDDFLAACAVEEHGFWVQWSDDLDIGADSIWIRMVEVVA